MRNPALEKYLHMQQNLKKSAMKLEVQNLLVPEQEQLFDHQQKRLQSVVRPTSESGAM